MTAYKPIHKRVNEIQRAKHANRQRDKIAQETSDPDLTFQPAINPISKQLVEARRIENDDATAFNVTARLMKDASESKARTLKLQEEYQKRESENNRYHPNISEASKALVNDMGDFARSDGNSFVRRQEILEEKKKKRQKARIAKMRERSECTFRPDTGSATAVLSHTRPHRLRESELERVERLYAQDRNAREQKKLSMAERYYNQFTFKPKINAISSGLAKSKTVEELVENQKNRHIKEQVAAKREREIRRQCTFKPKVNDSRRAKEILAKLPESQFRVDVHNPDKMVAAINAYRRDREVKLRQTRQEIEYEEMKECTFTPDVRPGHVPKQSGPVVVRGLGRYLELKDLARRLDDEKRAREKQAFKVQGVTHGGKKRGPTIPKPFKLSTTSGKENARRRALIDRVEAEKMKECTFQPKTTEARNRQLIEQILADDSDLYRD